MIKAQANKNKFKHEREQPNTQNEFNHEQNATKHTNKFEQEQKIRANI